MHDIAFPLTNSNKITKVTPVGSLTVLPCLLGFLLRAYTAFILPEFTADEHVQLASARHLAEGHGVSLVRVNPSDLASPVFVPLNLWPPGLAVVAAPLLQAGLPPFTVSRVLDIIGLGVFFMAWLLLFRQIKGLSKWVPVLFFLLAGISYSPCRLLGTTDIFSLAFSCLALSLLLWLFGRERENRVRRFAWAMAFFFGVSSFLPSFFRFAYYPVSILLPLMLVGLVWRFRRPLLPMALLSLIITLALLVGQQLYQYQIGQSLTYLSSHHSVSDRWLFPENLLEFDPVLVNSLFPEFLIRNKIGAGAAGIFNLSVSIVVGIVLALAFRQLIRRVKLAFTLQKPPPIREVFFLVLTCIGGAVLFFLVLMSLLFSPLPADWVPSGYWTYVQETRYFAPVLVFLSLLLLLVALKQYFRLGKVWVLTARMLLLASVGVSLSLLGYHLNRYSLRDGMANMRQYYGKSQDLAVFLQQQQLQQSALPVVYLFSQESVSYEPLLFTLEGAPALPVKELEGQQLQTTAPVRVFFSVYPELTDPDNLRVKAVAAKYNATRIATIPDLEMEIWEAFIKPKD